MILIRLFNLTPVSVQSAYKHVSAYVAGLQAGSDWCVLWSVWACIKIVKRKFFVLPEDGGLIFLRNAGVRLLYHTVLHSTTQQYEG
jgi:hypothetical protein